MFIPTLSLAYCLWVADSINLHAVTVWRAKGFHQLLHLVDRSKNDPLQSAACIAVFLRDAPFILDKVATGCAAKSWYFIPLFHSISGWSKILSCWTPSIRTEWTCHRAALTGEQESTPRRDLQKWSKQNRTFLVGGVANWQKNKPSEISPPSQHTCLWMTMVIHSLKPTPLN